MGLEQNLTLWRPLSKNIYSLRVLTRQHQRLQELKNQSENQKHAVLHSQFSDKFILKQLDKLIKLYVQQIQQVGQEIEKLLDKDQVLKTKIDKICKIKSLALLSVSTLVAETNGFEGFENVRQLVSFAGYDVVENLSGKRAGKTKISKKGNTGSPVRQNQTNFISTCLQCCQIRRTFCKALFKRVFERSQIKMKGYVAVQKKLLTLSFAIWKSNEEYNPMHYANNVKEPENTDKKIVPTSGTTQDVTTQKVLLLQ